MTKASEAGTFRIADKIVINRLGLGAMRTTGPGIWGESVEDSLTPSSIRPRLSTIDRCRRIFQSPSDVEMPRVSAALPIDGVRPAVRRRARKRGEDNEVILRIESGRCR
jgi:hypothetical protein